MKRRLFNLFRTSLIAGVMLVGLSATLSTADACPNCKDSLSEDSESEMARLGTGYSTSVLVMLGVMGCLVAGFGSAAYFVVKRSAAMPLPQQPGHSDPSETPDSPTPPRDA